MAYDYLCESKPQKASKEYLKILHLAAKESESKVDDALRLLFERGDGDGDSDSDSDSGGDVDMVDFDSVRMIVESNQRVPSPQEVNVSCIDLRLYDRLIVGEKSWNRNRNRNRCFVSLAPYK